ncbi:acetylornithine transaminase [Bacillus shivajii]|uniref:acetylornithine transaminase n=1 Tax=Bacillus shivajii TaxID=1983719 RepID=UPI001CFB56A3|nr:acetylornithine transaminase [Bacillus shivajii]UCZ53997.1 acetylornithine transaminase [Bacillus shivajii]
MSALFPTYARWDITVKEANGTTIIDNNGKEYLDFAGGIAVCNLGHCNERVNSAVKEQLDKVWHVSNLFHIEGQEKVAQLLTHHSDGDLVYFCNSGAEANEAAIKLARKHTGKTKMISFKQSFHGRTFASMSATGQDKIHQGYGPLLEEFIYLPFNDEVAVEKTIDETVAAVILEVVQGEGGVIPGENSFINHVAKLCQENGVLLIVDEVQTGIGRTGKPFAYQHYGITPDMITVAKGLGNGFPVGALIGKEELKETFGPGSHGSTFGGNPLAMTAAEAVLETVFEGEFLEEVTEKSQYFMAKLEEQLKGIDVVKEIRGSGLMIGIECTKEVADIMKKLRQQGLIVLNAGPNVVRLLPPLTVTYEELAKVGDMLEVQLKK